jgi:hypothetical protein
VKLRDFIVENILRAQGRNNCTDCAKLGRLLAGYLDAHPDSRETDVERARQMAEVIALVAAALIEDRRSRQRLD